MHVEIGDVRLSDTATLARLVEAEALPMDGLCLFLSDLGYFAERPSRNANPPSRKSSVRHCRRGGDSVAPPAAHALA